MARRETKVYEFQDESDGQQLVYIETQGKKVGICGCPASQSYGMIPERDLPRLTFEIENQSVQPFTSDDALVEAVLSEVGKLQELGERTSPGLTLETARLLDVVRWNISKKKK